MRHGGGARPGFHLPGRRLSMGCKHGSRVPRSGEWLFFLGRGDVEMSVSMQEGSPVAHLCYSGHKKRDSSDGVGREDGGKLITDVLQAERDAKYGAYDRGLLELA